MSLNADEQRAIATAATLAAAYRDGLGTAPAVPEVRPEAMVGRFGEESIEGLAVSKVQIWVKLLARNEGKCD